MAQGKPITSEASESLKRKMLDYLRDEVGANFLMARKHAGIGHTKFHELKNEDAEWATAMDDALRRSTEQALDFTESKLMKNIDKGKEASIFFFLKTKGKHRGYIERSETVQAAASRPVEMKEHGDSEEEKMAAFMALREGS